jgi:hypothetical protein
VPSRITAKNDDLSLEIDLETDGTPRVRSITVLGDDIKTEHLRRLPIARLTREAVDGAARKMDDGVFRLVSTPPAEAAAFYSDCMQNVRPVRKGSPITDEHLRQAVDVYRAQSPMGILRRKRSRTRCTHHDQLHGGFRRPANVAYSAPPFPAVLRHKETKS